MFARDSWYKRDSNYNEYLDSEAAGTLFQFISYQAIIDDVHVFNPTTVLNVRYGWNRFERNSGQQQDASELRPDHARASPRATTSCSRGRPELPAPRLRRHNDGRRRLRRRLPADHLAHGRRHAEQVAGRALAEGRRGDAHLPRAQPVHRQRPAASTSSTTPTPGRTAPAAPTSRACRPTPRSSSACPPRPRSRAPRTTPSTRRPGASSCRTTGGSTTS